MRKVVVKESTRKFSEIFFWIYPRLRSDRHRSRDLENQFHQETKDENEVNFKDHDDDDPDARIEGLMGHA